MAFDSLTEKLQNVFKNLRSKGRLTEADVKEAMKEIKRALLAAGARVVVQSGALRAETGSGSVPFAAVKGNHLTDKLLFSLALCGRALHQLILPCSTE